MKKLALVVALFAALAYGDGNVTSNTPNATPVAVTSQQAANVCVTASAAANAQATCTIPAVAGVSFYVTYIDIEYGAIAAPTATLLTTTTTNLSSGNTLAWKTAFPAAATDLSRVVTLGVPLKASAAGTAVTVVGNGAVASISQSITVCGFYAQ